MTIIGHLFYVEEMGKTSIYGDVTNRVMDVTGQFFLFFISFVTFETTIKSEKRMKNEKEI